MTTLRNMIAYGKKLDIKPKEIKYHDPEHGGYRANIVEGTYTIDGEEIMLTFWREGNSWGSEYYSGPNYTEPFNRKQRSHSRNWIRWKGLPLKYRKQVLYLKRLHREHYGN